MGEFEMKRHNDFFYKKHCLLHHMDSHKHNMAWFHLIAIMEIALLKGGLFILKHFSVLYRGMVVSPTYLFCGIYSLEKLYLKIDRAPRSLVEYGSESIQSFFFKGIPTLKHYF